MVTYAKKIWRHSYFLPPSHLPPKSYLIFIKWEVSPDKVSNFVSKLDWSWMVSFSSQKKNQIIWEQSFLVWYIFDRYGQIKACSDDFQELYFKWTCTRLTVVLFIFQPYYLFLGRWEAHFWEWRFWGLGSNQRRLWRTWTQYMWREIWYLSSIVGYVVIPLFYSEWSSELFSVS